MKYSYYSRRLFILFLTVSFFAVSGLSQTKKPISKKGIQNPATAQPCGVNGLTNAEQAELVKEQNEARARQKLTPLTWDCALARYAQQWANRGVFEHRADSSYGENMFVASEPSEPVKTAVKRWMSEESNWTNKTGMCAPGKFCNHYTQVMWKATTKVGCGVNRFVNAKWKVVLVCNYDPPGNTPGPAY